MHMKCSIISPWLVPELTGAQWVEPLPQASYNITPWVWDGTIVTVMGEDALNHPNGQVNTHPDLLVIQGS